MARVDQKVDRLVVLKGAQVNEQMRERFLQSLKYPGFNERRNQVADAYVDSLKWVFVGDNDDKSDDDDSDEDTLDYDKSGDSESGDNESGDNESDQEESDKETQSVESYDFQEARPSRGTSNGGSDFGSDSQNSIDSDAETEGYSERRFSNIRWHSFSNWLSSTDTIYWISGKPGSGKTTLVKYIVGHPRTKEYLQIWSPGCKIVYHYFWRPGKPMQKNLEGLFCSLLYQLLGSSATALGEVTSLVSQSGPKDSYTDWSGAELLSALIKALDSYEHGVCLFLDGLDEIDPENGTKDGIPELLDLALKLSQGNKPIKLCLASRPDPPILETRLSEYPRLRLQDLNFQDLMAYAREHVNFPETYPDPEKYISEDPIEWLVYKAEGVFLWLILATKSINEGVVYNDSAATLRQRIDRLPKDLDNLYQDMWERTCADNPLEYRQTAALYFKLLLARRIYWTADVFNVMLATTTPIADGVLDTLDEPSKLVSQDVMVQKCREVQQKLSVCCFGLVELSREKRWFRDETYVANVNCWYGRKYDSVLPFMARSLRFIHRTAQDFLTDTDSGATILGFNTESDLVVEYRLMRASLAELVIFAGETSVCDWLYMLRSFPTLVSTDEREAMRWNEAVLICEKLANSSRLMVEGISRQKYRCVGPDFLKVAASGDIGDQIIISRLENGNLSGDDKSGILLSLFGYETQRLDFGSRREEAIRLRTTCIRELLRAGADPNWQPEGASRWEVMFSKPYIWPYEPLDTPWQRYMLAVIQHLHLSSFLNLEVGTGRQNLAFMVEVAFLFASEGAELGDMVNMAIHWDSKEDTGWHVGSGITCAAKAHPHYIHDRRRPPNQLFASIPAYIILQRLMEAVRWYLPRGSEKTFSGDRSCHVQFLERECVNHGSTKVARVFGLVKEEGKDEWWETTDEVLQTQLGSRLIEEVLTQVWLPTPVVEGNDMDGQRTEQSVKKKILQSILEDESWVMKVHGDTAVSKRLEELGLVTKTNCEGHTIEEWVRKHNKNSDVGITSEPHLCK